MKTDLTRAIESRALYEFSKMGTFLCPEVGINIRRYGFPKRYYKISDKQTEQQLLEMGYKPYWHTDTEIVDILSWTSKQNVWRCYEIKISYQDFKSNSSKTFVGNYNYYIVPQYLVNKIEPKVPKEIGIYVYADDETKSKYYPRITCYRKAKRQELGCTQDELYYAMIKSLYRENSKK